MANKQGPLDFDFSTDEIILVIKSLKSNKANFGIVTNEILHCSPSAIAKPPSYLFNLILRTKVFPSTWNLSLIKPLHKTGSRSKHGNYRGICISNYLSKLFTAILHRRLEKWSIQNNILPNKSLGFRKGLRTEDGIFVLTTILDKYAKEGSKIYSCFIDFEKFYDSINHQFLFLELAEKGILGNFYFLLKDMYTNCSYAVKVLLPINDNPSEIESKKTKSYQWYRSASFKGLSGLKQGCNLSPLLANIFLSDLNDVIELGHMDAPKLNKFQITSISWADDLLILSLDKSGLQKCINNLELYAKEWGLVVSMKKTRCVIFSKGSTNYTNQHQFIYGDQLIPYEKFYKYLGVEITNNCEFKMAREQRITKARNAIFTGLAEPVRPLRPWSDQKSCHLWSKPSIFRVLVRPIIVRLMLSSDGRTNLSLLPPPLL